MPQLLHQLGENNLDYNNLQAAMCFHHGQFNESMKFFLKCHQINNEKPDFLTNIAVCLAKLKRPKDAVKILLINFDKYPSLHWAQLLYQITDETPKGDKAIAPSQLVYDAILAGKLTDKNIIMRCADFWGERDFAMAAKIYEIGLQYYPNELGIINNYAVLSRDLQDLKRTGELYDMAEKLEKNNPVIGLNKGYYLLTKGDFKNGWAGHELRYNTGRVNRSLPELRGNEWAGPAESLHAKNILIYAEQGYGEGIMFSRFLYNFGTLPDSMKPNKIIVLCQLGLERILHDSFGSKYGINIIATHPEWMQPGRFPADYDTHCPLLSLPYKFGINNSNGVDLKPFKYPYFDVNPRLREKFKKPLQQFGKNKFKIGFVWSGNPRQHDKEASSMNSRRSMDFDLLLPIINNPRVASYSFQVGDGLTKAEPYFASGQMFNCGEYSGDFADCAAMMSVMDLIISVDTSPCHLAGAIGKPVWLLNRFDSCWRWGFQGMTTPIYESMRIFRQAKPFDWAGLMQEIIALLPRYIENAPK